MCFLVTALSFINKDNYNIYITLSRPPHLYPGEGDNLDHVDR